MALIHCPDCGREVSDAATACPQCARPIRVTAPSGPVTVSRLQHSVRARSASAAVKFVCFVMIVVGICAGIAGAGVWAGVMAGAGFVGFVLARFSD